MISLEEITPYASIITAVFSLGTLGFLINIANLIRNAAKDKVEVLEARNTSVLNEAKTQQELAKSHRELLEERNKTLKEQIELTEKWHSRSIEELQIELEKNKEQLKQSFNDAGISLETLLSESSKGITEKVKQSLEVVVSDMLVKVEKINQLTESVNPELYLEMGKGLLATGEWKKAAEQFNKYIEYYPTDWEAQFSKAISFANSRENAESNLSALRACNEAIALFPVNGEKNLKARLFSYRAAMLKRLNRLEESKADLSVAQKLASDDYEILDIKYNLACVYALENDSENLFKTIQSLKNHSGHKKQLKAIHWHLPDYFALFSNNKEFLKLIEIETK